MADENDFLTGVLHRKPEQWTSPPSLPDIRLNHFVPYLINRRNEYPKELKNTHSATRAPKPAMNPNRPCHGSTVSRNCPSAGAKMGENIQVARHHRLEVSGNGMVAAYIHTGAKIQPGGVHSGLTSAAYQASGRFTAPEIIPAARVKNTNAIKARYDFFIRLLSNDLR